MTLVGIVWRGFYKNDHSDSDRVPRLQSKACWFKPLDHWPVTECYFMFVPENRHIENSRIISFPVIKFKSENGFNDPVLHLGAGGPGAAMQLDSVDVLDSILSEHDSFTLHDDRDLILIDPRGAGMSQPFLMCDSYVKNFLDRIRMPLDYLTEWQLGDEDYLQCLDKFHSLNVDFNGYNTVEIVNDLEFLRIELNIESWVLVGVSYAAVYAQVFAEKFPQNVSALILDSAAFPNIRRDDNFIHRTLAPYEALINYCELDKNCVKSMDDVDSRLWDLHKEFNENPIELSVDHPWENKKINLVMTGDRFLEILFLSVYDNIIFEDFPHLIGELEQNTFDLIRYYSIFYLSHHLDDTFGDMSFSSHYCFEEEPYLDRKKMLQGADEIDNRWLRDFIENGVNWPENCEGYKLDSQYFVDLATANIIDVPTIFVQGYADPITPLADIEAQAERFSNHKIVTFYASHSVLSSTTCAEYAVEDFIKNTDSWVNLNLCENKLEEVKWDTTSHL